MKKLSIHHAFVWVLFGIMLGATTPIAQAQEWAEPLSWLDPEAPVMWTLQGVTPPPVGSGGPSATRPTNTNATTPTTTGGDAGSAMDTTQPPAVYQPVFPLSIYAAFGFNFGFEFWDGPPNRFSVTFGFNLEFGLAINPAPDIRFTLVPLSVDVTTSAFSYTDPVSLQKHSKSTLGSRWLIGADVDIYMLSVGIRFGSRDYWQNPRTDGDSISLIGNDRHRYILHLIVAYSLEIARMGMTLEFPFDSASSAFTLLFHIQLRWFS